LEYALTTHPLSTAFRHRFENAVGARPTYLEYPELRKLSPANLVQRLRTLGASRLFLPIEDEASRSILPLLKGIAAVTDAKTITVVDPECRFESVPRWAVGRAVADLVSASVRSARDMARCQAEVRHLLSSPRIADKAVDRQTVLYVNANVLFGLKSGGSIGHVAGVVNALADGGRDVVLASQARTMIRPQVGHVPLTPGVYGLPFEKSSYSFHRAMVELLIGHYGSSAPGFIYQRMSPANYAGVSLSRRWGVPLVLEYNGSEVWVAKNWGRAFRYQEIAQDVESVCLRHAHVVVTISEVLADELADRGVPRDRIVWYPNCVDPSVFDPARFSSAQSLELRQRHGIADDALVITFIGTFGQWHGVNVFAGAIRRLIDENRAWMEQNKVRFVLVGDGLLMPSVRQAIGAPDCAPFVTLTGLVPQDQAPSYLEMADVVVSPHVPNHDGSRFFGSPTKLFEYMAMGKPIVASDLDQIGQVLETSVRAESLPAGDPGHEARELAVLCQPGDEQSLMAGMRFVVERPSWRARLGRNARGEALSKYCWSHHVDAILAGLDALTTREAL